MISNNSINNNSNQPQRRSECVTIGRIAPDFIALSTQGYVRLSDYRGRWVVLSSNPSAFGAVSTTEIINAAQLYSEILKRNAVIIGLTTDNIYANLAWVYDIYQETGVTVPFPIIADSELEISEMYGMLNPDRLYGETVRDAFIISPFGNIKAIITMPSSTGRNSHELIRILDSLQIKEKYNLDTPSDWKQGDPVLVPNPTSYGEIINRAIESESLGYNCPLWYVCYTNLPVEGNINPVPQDTTTSI
jgi:peroxiredoxin (alkyl hydroperoxide reductase subunit C)